MERRGRDMVKYHTTFQLAVVSYSLLLWSGYMKNAQHFCCLSLLIHERLRNYSGRGASTTSSKDASNTLRWMNVHPHPHPNQPLDTLTPWPPLAPLIKCTLLFDIHIIATTWSVQRAFSYSSQSFAVITYTLLTLLNMGRNLTILWYLFPSVGREGREGRKGPPPLPKQRKSKLSPQAE